jgi:hypothetical protein
MSKFKDELREQAVNAAVEQGSKLAAKGFRAWMDSIARRRPKGLVARFRRFFGRVPEEDSRDFAKRFADELRERIEAERRARGDTPAQRPSAKRGGK